MLVCASMSKNVERLACFDSVAAAFSQPIVKDKKPNIPKALDENIGGSKFDKVKDKKKVSRGSVVSCQKSRDGKWFFVFDNGQVWKQTDRLKRRYKDCSFNVTISEDGFGYKILVDGEKGPIRMRRKR